MRLWFVSLLVMVVALCAGLWPSSTPGAAVPEPEPRAVGSEYFSTHLNFSLYGDERPHTRRFKRALRGIRAAGFREVRVVFSWAEMEPLPPIVGVHRYRWRNFDRYVSMAAARGIRVRAVLGYPPRWASTDRSCVGGEVHAGEPKALTDWAKAVEAFVDRYGSLGNFWWQNSELSRLPIRSYEISNEPNLEQFWCPRPDPERYAAFLSLAAGTIHEMDSAAEVISGGVISAANRPAGDPSIRSGVFFKRVFRAKPRLVRQIDAVGVHLYEFKSIGDFFDQLAIFRRELRRAGVPGSMPLQITETGWLRRPGIGYTDAERARLYRATIRAVPRSNCNVDGMTAYAWLTPEKPGRLMSFLGLANPKTLKPYRSVRTIRRQLAVMRGQGPVPPPAGTVRHCRRR